VTPDGVKWARRGGKGGVSAVLKPGDVVYVEPMTGQDGQWRLRQQPQIEGAMVAMDPYTGRVLALAGGFSFDESQFNRATQAMRQPGSAFKAFVFLAAFEAGYGAGNMFTDGPIRIGKWQPGNYNDKFYGEVNLREAFARSLNSVAVQLSEQVGRKNVIAAAQRLGITTPIGNDASIALGTSETTLLEMTTAYAVFAHQGKGVWPYTISRITTRAGDVLYERNGSGPGRVASASANNAMLDVMNAVVEWGTGKKAKIDRPVYGKTGTSQNFRDAWFIGLTADLVTGVWVGNDNGAAMDKVTGGSLPVVIWHDFMTEALANVPPRDIVRASGGTLVASAGAPVELAPEIANQVPESQEESGIGALLSTILGGGASEPDSDAAPATSQKKKPSKLKEDTKHD
jgi:penicillin-binding protein 1A